MSVIQPPKKWAYLVAVGPASIGFGLMGLGLATIGLPGGPELFIVAAILNGLAVPAVMIGI
jgi:hypothetical protein